MIKTNIKLRAINKALKERLDNRKHEIHYYAELLYKGKERIRELEEEVIELKDKYSSLFDRYKNISDKDE